MRLRVLSLNIWALPVPLPFEERRRRMDRLAERLPSLDADIIALQEAFHPGDRDRLERVMASRGYHATACRTRRILGIVPMDATGGLLVLSRFPVHRQAFVAWDGAKMVKLDERLAGKGALRCRLAGPAGAVDCVDIHLYAGRSDRHTAVRLRQLAAAPLDEEPGALLTLLAGDLNASIGNGTRPPSAEETLLHDRGFTDAWGTERPVTYAISRNRYARLRYSRPEGDHRLDFVLFRAAPGVEVVVRRAEVVFDAPDDLVSDHYGLMVDLDVHGPATGGA